MRIHEILYFIKTYFLLGLIGVGIAGILFSFIFYRRLYKGRNLLSTRELVLWSLFSVYMIMVMEVTFLNRGSNFQGSVNIHFLSSYIEAWNTYSLRSWQFIILNIFMFVPFGFLLPLLHKRFQKIHYTMPAVILFTLFIELVQLATGIGIFEIDDLFNNTLGALIGYGMIMELISAFGHQEERKQQFNYI